MPLVSFVPLRSINEAVQKQPRSGKNAGGLSEKPPAGCVLPLQTYYFIQELIGHRDDTRTGLEAPLRGDHVREFLCKVNIGFLQ